MGKLQIMADLLKHKFIRYTTTRKILTGSIRFVADCFGAALLLQAAAWKNTPHYHYRRIGGVIALPTAPLVSGPDHVPNPDQNRDVGWVCRPTDTVIMVT
jgi:hypothetical protein